MSKFVTFVGKRIWEFVTNNAGQIIVWAGGTSVTYYLASITIWAQATGPLGWALIAVIIMFIVSLTFFVWSKASINRYIQAFAKNKIEVAKVNVLAPAHSYERINFSEFYSPYFFHTRDVIFTDCELYGPASVAVFGGTFNSCGFVDCEIVIVRKDRPVKGAIALNNCTFLRGKLVRLSLLMNFEQYQLLPETMRQAIPVISDGCIGNV